MKYCSQCGQQLPDEARFCNKCGAAIPEGETAAAAVEQEVKPQGKSFPIVKKRAVITGIVIALLLVAGGFLGWRSLGSEAQVQKKLDLAVKYLSENKFEEAILAYNEAIKIEPKEVKAYQGLARVYTLQGKYDDAQATYDKGLASVAQDKKQTLQMGLAGMYIDQGQLASAEKAFQEIKNSNKACLEAYWGLAMVYQKQGDNAKAEAMLRQAVDQNPNEYRAYNTLALFLKQNNKADEAFNNLVKSLALEINQQEAYLVLSDLYKGRLSQLQAKLAAVSNQQVSAMLEFYSYYAAGDYQKALTVYKNKLSQQTGNQKARVLAAIAMVKTGDKTGAETLVNQLSKEKLNEWLLSDLAYYYQAAGDKEKAKEYAVKALQANGFNLDAIALLQNLNNEDTSARIYTAQALLYNWKPVGKVKEEMKAMSLPVPDSAGSPVAKADSGSQDQSMYGNSPGNLINGGTVCQNGDWIYFANTGDMDRLYRVRTDGTGKQKLAEEDPVYSINVSNGWIYYLAGRIQGKGYLYRMRTDGTDKKKISEELFYEVCVYGDRIYFDSKKLSFMRTDGSQVQYFNDSDISGVSNVIASGDWIYYLGYELYYQGTDGKMDSEIYRIHADGSDRRQISKKYSKGPRIFYFIVAGDWIYFNKSSDGKLYRIRTDGSDEMRISDEEVSSFNVNETWIYYTSNISNRIGIYRMQLDGKGLEKISQENTYKLNIIQDWIYFKKLSFSGLNKRNEYLYRMHLDGTGMELVG